ncbi:hypothetical protein ACTJJ7_15370 [Phyllobacterium sp. 22229]
MADLKKPPRSAHVLKMSATRADNLVKRIVFVEFGAINHLLAP